MTLYNWQQPDWPHFKYDLSSAQEDLLFIAEKMGLINGKFSHLSTDIQTETIISHLVEEAVKTSEIEGEFISRPDIRSSIKNQLGLNQTIAPINDKRANGVAKLMLALHQSFNDPLDASTLFNWHAMLLSDHANPTMAIGNWRTHEDPMQIISGVYGKFTIHFEAPPSKQVANEMKQFIRWFNNTAPEGSDAILYAPVRAAIAHLYFESIHPFEDGNGRIGRAIAEKALSQGFGYPVIISLSQSIESEKRAYYTALQNASLANEISVWIKYFINLIVSAQLYTEHQINFILKKTHFFDHFKTLINPRELKVIKRMMEAGTAGFEGGISAKKYIAITGTSKATATRDLQHLANIHALISLGSGRNARYELNITGPW